MNMKDKLAIISHRGGKSKHLENTLEAFLYAVDVGAEAIEMDIRYSYLNRHFFLAHDFIHHPKRRLNFLDKSIQVIPSHVTLIIEFKTLSFLSNAFVKNFKKFYDEHLSKRNIIVQSFNPFVLIRMRKIAPQIPRGIICGSHFWKFVHNSILCRFVDAQYYILNKRYLNRRNVTFAREQGMKIYPYVVNTQRVWKKAIRYDVDGVITDYPVKFMKLRSELKK